MLRTLLGFFMRSWISSTVKLDRGALVLTWPPCFVVFLSPQGRFGGALRWSDTMGLPSTRCSGAAAAGEQSEGSGTYLTILTVLTMKPV